MLMIGLPKGCIKDKSIELVESLIGKNEYQNKLSFRNDDFSIFLLKHRDIPNMVEEGLLDIGITSEEWIEENQNNVNILKVLEWCNTNISLIVASENKVVMNKTIKCVTEFPKIANKYFTVKKIPHEIYHISGSSESLVPDLFDCCIDCVETGRTLLENNLLEKDVIFESKIVVIGRKDIKKDDRNIKQLLDFIDCISQVRK